MKILSIVGARPNFVKLAAIHTALQKKSSASHLIVHTGQHYDFSMNEQFFQDFQLPQPDFHLGIGSGSPAQQIGNTMIALEPVLSQIFPDWVIVVGDVNATIAGAIVAKKLNIRLAHVEAGLRSKDWTMPEETNRIITDRLSDVMYVSEESGIENLRSEGVEESRIVFVGNVMIDTLLQCLPIVESRDTLIQLGVQVGHYVVVTLHRPSNTDEPKHLLAWMKLFEQIADDLPVVFPVHPRTQNRLTEFGYLARHPKLILTKPQSYLDMLALLRSAKAVLTDSGGVQEETTALGVPCFTLRDNTERPVTITQGTNHLVGSIPEKIYPIFKSANDYPVQPHRPALWDGHSAERIVEHLLTCKLDARSQ
jgi:UDP-N-acetylglucosamine 2-epimerase (non-hydrolysing)